MNRRSFLENLAALPLSAAAAARAQNQSTTGGAGEIQKRGRELTMLALEALGGKAFLEMQDRVEAGRAYSFYRERLTGLSVARIFTRYLSAAGPGELAVRERQQFGKDESSAVLFREDEAWEISFRGARPLPNEIRDRYRETTLRNIFYILRVRLEEPGLVMEYRGADRWENQPVEVVDVIDSENRVVEVYFSPSSKLPLRQFTVRRDPNTRQKFDEVTVFSKYRDAGGGVQWPFVIERTRNGEKIFEMFSSEVAVNGGLSDELFTLPANMKKLKPAR